MKLLLSPFIYILSLFFFKNKNRWCFGSWFGDRFADNSKFLFEVAEQDPTLDAYWITNNLNVYKALKSENRKVLLSFSLKGIYIQLTSYVFICSVNSKDFYFPCITRRNMFIQSWHGAPIKKIGFDVNYSILSKTTNLLRRFLIDNYNYVISPAERFDNIFMSAMRVNRESIIRSACPRCDSFNISNALISEIREQLTIDETEKFIFYLPTHRSEGSDVEQILKAFEAFKQSNCILKSNNLKVIIKLHPYDLKHIDLFEDESSNVKMFRDDLPYDLYQILAASDSLITDYSSVMFEYELQDKDIFYFVPDLTSYTTNLRGLYFSYEALIESPIKDFNSLLTQLIKPCTISHRAKLLSNNNVEIGSISLKLMTELKRKVSCG